MQKGKYKHKIKSKIKEVVKPVEIKKEVVAPVIIKPVEIKPVEIVPIKKVEVTPEFVGFESFNGCKDFDLGELVGRKIKCHKSSYCKNYKFEKCSIDRGY